MAKEAKKVGRIAGTMSELKQVSWPTMGDMFKKLGSVLVITGLFLVVFMGFDALLKWFYSALVMGVVGDWNSAAGYFVTYTEEGAVALTMYLSEMIAAAIVAGAVLVCSIIAIMIIKAKVIDKEN